MKISLCGAMLIAALAVTTTAHAHAFLTRAVPPVGGHVAVSPTELDLYYTEGVVAHFSSVELLGPSGQRIATGALKTAADGRELIMPVPKLAPGTYTVIWHATAEDTHKTEGRYNFTIAP